MMMETDRILFTKEMKKDYTILIPNMAPIHFEFIKNIFISYGYKMELLYNDGRAVVDTGLKYVHNDTCYPALLCIGQMISALESGKYDLNKTALMITQTGGGCRASNYIHLLRKALIKAGMDQIPVISLNLSGLEKNSGFKFTIPMVCKALYALAYGDMLMLLDNQTKPYEVHAGDSRRMVEKWISRMTKELSRADIRSFTPKHVGKILTEMAQDFAKIEVVRTDKIKVGIVGEIYVKYSSLGNNHLEEFLLSQNCEVMVPGIIGFLLFKLDNRIEDIKLYGGNKAKLTAYNTAMRFFTKIEEKLIAAAKTVERLTVPSPYAHLKHLASKIIGVGCKMGEGWLLTAEIMELVENGYSNVVCTQPFGCLPNHIVGKGMLGKIKELYPQANIVPIDYDPGATKVNQENRIKLMLAVAMEGHGVRG